MKLSFDSFKTLQTLSCNSLLLSSSSLISHSNPQYPHSREMAETGNGSNDGGGDEGARSRDEVEAPRPRIDDQPVEGASASLSAGERSSGNGNGGHA